MFSSFANLFSKENKLKKFLKKGEIFNKSVENLDVTQL